MFPSDTARWLIVFWLFVVGGCIGSFLNVVVYRLPRGISLIYPPSRCPKCGKRIRWFDNVPIFGWIMLRGRCRDCHNPISVLYPVVEAVTATMFGLLAAVEMDRLTTIYPIHLLLLCTLVCAGLIEYDGHQPPLRLFIPALLVGVTTHCSGLFWPSLRPTWAGWRGLPAPWALTIYVLNIVGILVLIGMVLGMAWWVLRGQKWAAIVIGVICVGLFLDVQACPIVGAAAVLYLLFWLLGRVYPRLRIPPSMLIGVVTLAWILIWARLVSS